MPKAITMRATPTPTPTPTPIGTAFEEFEEFDAVGVDVELAVEPAPPDAVLEIEDEEVVVIEALEDVEDDIGVALGFRNTPPCPMMVIV